MSYNRLIINNFLKNMERREEIISSIMETRDYRELQALLSKREYKDIITSDYNVFESFLTKITLLKENNNNPLLEQEGKIDDDSAKKSLLLKLIKNRENINDKIKKEIENNLEEVKYAKEIRGLLTPPFKINTNNIDNNRPLFSYINHILLSSRNTDIMEDIEREVNNFDNIYKNNTQLAGKEARKNLIKKLNQLDIKKAKDLLYGFVDSTGIKRDWIINNSNNSQTMETILNNATRSNIGTLIKNTLLERVQNRGQQQGM